MRALINLSISRITPLLIIICFLCIPAYAKYGGGTGEPNDPYQIATTEDLILLGDSPEDYDRRFILTTDIDLDPNLPGLKIFDKAVISQFAGIFDGNNLKISNLVISASDVNTIGLFGSNIGTIKNVILQNINVIGLNETGGLCGRNVGCIDSCTSSGIVRGEDYIGHLVGVNRGGAVRLCESNGEVFGRDYVGGLVGQNGFWVQGRGEVWPIGGLINNCYSLCNVTGKTLVGGFVALNDIGIITQCYSNGNVSGNEQSGGFVGKNNAVVNYCFWDVETSNMTFSAAGTGKTTTQMQDPNTFMEVGWDFVDQADGPHDIWSEPEVGGYPILSWQLSPGFGLPEFSGGNGQPDDPYLITKAEELNSIGHNPRLMAAHFELRNNVNVTDVKFFIIGDEYFPFKGIFNGNSHTISHLTITGDEYVGLFGILESGAVVRDLGIIDVNITGFGDYVGGMVGKNSGILNHCYSTGTISGNWYVGGLVGYNYDGHIIHCHNTGIVNGDWFVGGLTGVNYKARVIQSYCSSNVSGEWHIGGLVGTNAEVGEIINCYASGEIIGEKYIGGLVGNNVRRNNQLGKISRCYSVSWTIGSADVGGLIGWNSGVVESSFWDTETSYQTTSYGGIGKTTAQMQMQSTFTDAGWDFADETANGTEDIWWIDEGKDYPRLWWERNEAGQSLVIELDETNFDAFITNGVVLVDFYATWCPHCTTQAPILEEVAELVQSRARVAKLDVDKSRAIAQRYEVNAIPTLILFQDGLEVQRFVGVTSADILVAAVLSAVDS